MARSVKTPATPPHVEGQNAQEDQPAGDAPEQQSPPGDASSPPEGVKNADDGNDGASDAADQNGGEEAQDTANSPAADDSEVSQDAAPYGVKADGTPAKKRGRKPKSTQDEADKQRARLRSVGPGKGLPQKVQTPDVNPALAVVNYQALGETAANLWFNVGMLAMGEDWKPDNQGEALAVAGAFRDYFKSQQIKDIPPGLALTLVLTSYSLAHAQKPTVKTRLQKVGAWFKEKAKNVRIR